MPSNCSALICGTSFARPLPPYLIRSVLECLVLLSGYAPFLRLVGGISLSCILLWATFHNWLHHHSKPSFKKHVQNSKQLPNPPESELRLTSQRRQNHLLPFKHQHCLPVAPKRKMAGGRVDSSLTEVQLVLAKVEEGVDTLMIGKGKGVGGRSPTLLVFVCYRAMGSVQYNVGHVFPVTLYEAPIRTNDAYPLHMDGERMSLYTQIQSPVLFSRILDKVWSSHDMNESRSSFPMSLS
jgi:hypothetical protein